MTADLCKLQVDLQAMKTFSGLEAAKSVMEVIFFGLEYLLSMKLAMLIFSEVHDSRFSVGSSREDGKEEEEEMTSSKDPCKFRNNCAYPPSFIDVFFFNSRLLVL